MTAKGFDAELAFPLLSDYLLPGVLVGMMLAGVFAATVSTADSQVLSCSAAITQDLFPSLRTSYTAVKVATLSVTAAALGFALLSIHEPDLGGSVFKLVIFAWSALAAGLGPLLVVRALGTRITTPVALAMMVAGIGAVLVWRFELAWQGHVYDALPGMVAGTVVYLVAIPLMGDASADGPADAPHDDDQIRVP
jgi:sodium/proline symporter